MTEIVRVQPKYLHHRLDVRYNSPSAVNARMAIASSGLKVRPVGQLLELVCGPFGSTLTSDEHCPHGEVLLVQPTNLSGELFSDDTSWRITKNDLVEKGLKLYTEGTLLFARVGIYPHTGVLPQGCGLVTISSSMIAGIPVKSIDTYYLASFFQSAIGYQLLLAAQKVTAQPTIGTSEIGATEVPVPQELVQKYIGDKVRQAERLRAWAKHLERSVKEVFEADIQWNDKILRVPNYGKVGSTEIEGRLDLKFNSPQRISLKRHFHSANVETDNLAGLADISAMIGWKGLTTEFYRDSGPWLLRGVEFNDGIINTDSLVCVDEFKYLEQPQIHLKENDVAFSKDGTIGKAVVIPLLPNRLAAGSTIARLRIKESESLDPYYLEFALGHPCVQVQVESFATGIAQPHITQEWIARLEIPRIKSEEAIADMWRQHHAALSEAKGLTKAAKQLVESLIDGVLAEQQLIDSQKALESDDNSLDREILGRLTTKGLDGDGDPLFVDLDQLYDLLAQCQQMDE